MAFNPTRQAVQKMLGFETATHQPSSIQHYTTTIILFSVITALGATIRSLGKVYTLLGGFSATFLAYILPAIACLVTRRYPAVEIQPLLAPTAVRPACSSTEEEALLSEATISVVPVKEEEDFVPKFGLLDLSAIVLLLWGLIVMVFSTSGVLFT
jgi:sodium-coupled neutral amino acid transporter 11